MTIEMVKREREMLMNALRLTEVNLFLSSAFFTRHTHTEREQKYKSAANKSCNTSLTTTRRQLDLINTRRLNERRKSKRTLHWQNKKEARKEK